MLKKIGVYWLYDQRHVHNSSGVGGDVMWTIVSQYTYTEYVGGLQYHNLIDSIHLLLLFN